MESKHAAIYGQSINTRFASKKALYQLLTTPITRSHRGVWSNSGFPYLLVLLTFAANYRFFGTSSVDHDLSSDSQYAWQTLWTLLPINAPVIILTLSFAISEIFSLSRLDRVPGGPSVGPSFLLGVGSALDIGGNSFSAVNARSTAADDEAALADDWASVGDDIEGGLRIFRWRTAYKRETGFPLF